MTPEEVRNKMQFCMQMASTHLQWNGRSDSTCPTAEDLINFANKLFDAMCGVEV
jgi:hypothetical protein